MIIFTILSSDYMALISEWMIFWWLNYEPIRKQTWQNWKGNSIEREKRGRTHMIERSRFISAQITPQQQFKLIRFLFSSFSVCAFNSHTFLCFSTSTKTIILYTKHEGEETWKDDREWISESCQHLFFFFSLICLLFLHQAPYMHVITIPCQ